MKLSIFLLMLLAPLFATAEIFKTTDAQGNVSYTDKPPAGSAAAEQVELKPLNTTPPPEVVETAPEPTTDEPEAMEKAVVITHPGNETTIPMGPGNFSVNATVTPPLSKGQSLQLQIDGSNSGPAQVHGSWNLSNVFRGAHNLTVTQLGRDGEPVAVSDPVRIYVLRPSIIKGARAPRT